MSNEFIIKITDLSELIPKEGYQLRIFKDYQEAHNYVVNQLKQFNIPYRCDIYEWKCGLANYDENFNRFKDNTIKQFGKIEQGRLKL